MNPFSRKSAELPAASAQLPVLYAPPVKPSAAPKAGELEREIRREIWQHMSPDLARSARLSLSDLIDFTTGVLRLSPLQLDAIARKMGIIDTPVSGLAVIREAMERATRGTFPTWGAAGNRRHRNDTLGEEDALSCRHHDAVQAFIAGDNSALTFAEIDEFLCHWRGTSDAYYDPEADPLCKRDTATAQGSGPPPFVAKPFQHRTHPFAGTQIYPPPMYPRDPSLPAPGPARLEPSPGWA